MDSETLMAFKSFGQASLGFGSVVGLFVLGMFGFLKVRDSNKTKSKINDSNNELSASAALQNMASNMIKSYSSLNLDYDNALRTMRGMKDDHDKTTQKFSKQLGEIKKAHVDCETDKEALKNRVTELEKVVQPTPPASSIKKAATK